MGKQNLKATGELADMLVKVHSLLQEMEQPMQLEIAARMVVVRFGCTLGYAELLIEILTELGELEYDQTPHPFTGFTLYRLKFVGRRDPDFDMLDLERLGMAGVSQRLADRLNLQKVEQRERKAQALLKKQRMALQQAQRQLDRAKLALERRRLDLKKCELGSRSDVLAHAQYEVDRYVQRVKDLESLRDSEQKRLEDLQ